MNLGPESDYSELYDAIVCGSKIKSPYFKQIFQQSGLLHLIVVSGSHLVFLAEILSRMRLRSAVLQTSILASYVLVCQMQAPSLRSFFVFVTSLISEKYALHMPKFYQYIISTVFCLMLFPSWASSISLKLSLLAAIGLSLSHQHTKQCWIIFLLIMPILFFGNMGIVSLINNIFLSPVIGLFLFPLSLLVKALPFLGAWVDYIWISLLEILCFINGIFPPTKSHGFHLPNQEHLQWLYILIALYFTRKSC